MAGPVCIPEPSAPRRSGRALAQKSMNRTLPLVSIGLNVVLTAWIVALLQAGPGGPRGKAASNRTTEPAVPAAALASRVSLRPEPTAAPSQARFDWHQVESEDYKQYLANLRAIGCPEQTVREIIRADVNDLFASKAAALTRTNQYQYWRREPLSRSPEQLQELQGLDGEKRELLRALGVDGPDFAELLAQPQRFESRQRGVSGGPTIE